MVATSTYMCMSETKIHTLEKQKAYQDKISELTEDVINSVENGEFSNKKVAVDRISEWAVECIEIVTESEIESHSQSETVAMTCYDTDNMSSEREKQYRAIEKLRKDMSRDLDMLW
jgi:hypothetical protein